MTRKERLENHVKTLQEMRNVMLENENWENLKRFIEAVTTGGMAIQRIIREDFPEERMFSNEPLQNVVVKLEGEEDEDNN